MESSKNVKNNLHNKIKKNKLTQDKLEESTFYKDEITLREEKPEEEEDDSIIYEEKEKEDDDEDKPVDKKELISKLESSNGNTNPQWKNRQRVLVVASRGVTHQERILMNNIISLLPHSKKECKIDRKVAAQELNEICFNHSCTNCVYFEHKKREFVMWVFRSPDGPTLKFQINHIHTFEEPKLAGNSLKYSRPILNFDESFNSETNPHLGLIKEMFTHVFNTPKNHPKSKPFYDHILNFYNAENTFFFRNYQILNDVKQKFCNTDDTDKLQLIEIGPRFSLTLIKIFSGTLGGKCLYTNPKYISPSEVIKRNSISYKARQLKLLKEEEEFKEKTKEPVDVQTRWVLNNK